MTPEQRLVSAVRSFIRNDHPDNYIRMVRALERLDGKEVDPEPPVWVPATWGDVIKGDRVRYQDYETVIGTCFHEPGTLTAVKIRGHVFRYLNEEPVEIQMDRKRRDQHEGGIPF